MKIQFLKPLVLLAFLAAGVLTSCSDDDSATDTETETDKTSGYMLTSIAYSAASASYFGGYFPDMPTGTFDMTQKKAFQFVHPITSYKNVFFSQATDGTNGLAKIIVNAKGEMTEGGRIASSSYICGVSILSDNVGVYSEQLKPGQLFLFDPETMTKTGAIDMTGATVFEGNDTNIYYNLVHRPQDNKLFAFLYTSNLKTSQYYDARAIYAEVINLDTKKREKTIVYEDAMDPHSRGSLNPIIDEAGNVYILTQGSYGLDGNLGPAAPAYAKPQLLKIPAGTTEFDAEYTFNPILAIDPTLNNTVLVHLAVGIIYDKNGAAYACLSAKPYDNPRIYELIGKFSSGTITQDEIAELSDLVLLAAGLKWAKIDLATRAVTVIEDMPFTAGFSYPTSMKYDGKLYLQMYNPDANINGFYEYDPANGASRSLYNITGGGVAVGFMKLSE